MTAICPAGPPKVCIEMRNQARTAVRNGTTVCSCEREGVSESTGVLAGSGRLAAEEQATTVVLVEPVEEGPGDGERVLVGAGHRQPAQQDVEPGGLGRVEPLVVEVGLVDRLGDPPQHRV